MKSFFKEYWFLLITFLISFVIFYPSLFVFFTNDDFFFLKISQANNLGQFFNFFNIFQGPDGFGMYRPLTTQVFYFLSWKFFHLSPLPLHIISFLFFFGVIYLVYRLVIELLKNEKTALLSAFLYAVSATHFGHLYYLAAFQELGMTLLVLLSCLMFIKQKNMLSFIFFILALMSKETAIVTPILLALIYLFKKINGSKVIDYRRLFTKLLPFVICSFIYLLIRVRWYGFATGDSYIWDFSIKKMFNTGIWYLLWSLNIPEALVDYMGSGFKIDPNLFIFWGNQIKSIIILFLVQGLMLSVVLTKDLFKVKKSETKENNLVSLFCFFWFLISLLPVIFLPFHKFTFYLTLPIIGIVFRISYVITSSKISNLFVALFLITWTTTSVLTLKFTIRTNWITQDEIISQKVFMHFRENSLRYSGTKLAFVDTQSDSILPWSPTMLVKNTLSDKNFFYVFFPSLAENISYGGTGNIQIKSRQFLGY
jgi:hypothetical protein